MQAFAKVMGLGVLGTIIMVAVIYVFYWLIRKEWFQTIISIIVLLVAAFLVVSVVGMLMSLIFAPELLNSLQ